jgi:amino acid transporter
VAGLVTMIEVGGLMLVISASAPALAEIPDIWSRLIPPPEGMVWMGIFSGAILAFYAFIGFEDMVDVAEEVKEVKKTLPRAILLTLGITTILYFILLVTVVLAMPPAELAQAVMQRLSV